MTTFRINLLVLLAILCSLSASLAAEETWKVNLKNADIREFVAQVSTITGKALSSTRVKGNVTVISSSAMDKDAIYEVFLSVLRVHGYAAVPAGNVTKIVQRVLAKQSANPTTSDSKAQRNYYVGYRSA